MVDFKKPAVVIGHPGHELRAFKFIKEHKPDIFIITDGSGATNISRVDNSIKIIESLGARYIKLFEPIPDKLIYRFMLEGNIAEIHKIKNDLSEKFIIEGYDFVIGDSLEGFNPTHDLCRYIINSIVKDCQLKANRIISNYSFDLDKAPNKVKNNVANMLIELHVRELEQKYEAAISYPELKFEVEKVLKIYGKEAFKFEYYSKIDDPNSLKNWDEISPQYENFGKEKVNNCLYPEVIQFEKHMKPIALSLLDL
jgi:hypothetical protein